MKTLALIILLVSSIGAQALPSCDPIQLRIYHGTNGLTISVRVTNSWCCGIRTLCLDCQQPNGQWVRIETNRIAVCTDWAAAFTVTPSMPNARFRTVQVP